MPIDGQSLALSVDPLSDKTNRIITSPFLINSQSII